MKGRFGIKRKTVLYNELYFVVFMVLFL